MSNKDTVTFPASVNTSDYSFVLHTAHLTTAGAAATAADVHQEREFIWHRFQSATHHFFLSFFLSSYSFNTECWVVHSNGPARQQQRLFFICCIQEQDQTQTDSSSKSHTLAMQTQILCSVKKGQIKWRPSLFSFSISSTSSSSSLKEGLGGDCFVNLRQRCRCCCFSCCSEHEQIINMSVCLSVCHTLPSVVGDIQCSTPSGRKRQRGNSTLNSDILYSTLA